MHPLRNLMLTAVLVLAFATTLTAADAPVTGRLKVLLITGGHGFEKQPFLELFQSNSAITFTHAAHSRTNAFAYERADLLTYDVVVLYDMIKTISDKQKAAFLSLFDKGSGLVVLHHALVSYQNWDDYARIIGGKYSEEEGKEGHVTEQVGYQHDVDFHVTIVDPNHPLTAGLKDFMIHDEIYWGYSVNGDVTPLITTDHARSGKPLGWTRTESKSRVVYLQLGHDHSAYENPHYRALLARAIQWSARR